MVVADILRDIARHARLSRDAKHAKDAERLARRYGTALYCLACGDRLFGNQTKYCGRFCADAYWNHHLRSTATIGPAGRPPKSGEAVRGAG